MRDHPTLIERLSTLPEPVKNHYFFGMLLNEHSLFKEQHYFDDKRFLLNRLTLGGRVVLAGLNFVTGTQNDKDGKPILTKEPKLLLNDHD